MSKKIYSAGLVSKLLWFNELKNTAILKEQSFSDDELKEMVFSENLYQINNIERNMEIFHYCLKRIELLDDKLLNILKYGTNTDARVVALISIMKCEKIMFDFLYEVYREKIILGDYVISEKDMRKFFDYKVSQSDEIAKWSENTFYKMSQTILKMLVESGLLIQEKYERRIENIILGSSLEEYLKNELPAYYKAITGEN